MRADDPIMHIDDAVRTYPMWCSLLLLTPCVSMYDAPIYTVCMMLPALPLVRSGHHHVHTDALFESV